MLIDCNTGPDAACMLNLLSIILAKSEYILKKCQNSLSIYDVTNETKNSNVKLNIIMRTNHMP